MPVSGLLVGGGLFHMIDGNNADLGLFRSQLQPNLLLKCIEEARSRFDTICDLGEGWRLPVEEGVIRREGDVDVISSGQASAVHYGTVENEQLEKAAQVRDRCVSQ